MGKKSQSQSNSTVYGKTTTTNPYATSQTTNNGTVTTLNSGTTLSSVYDFVNRNIDSLLDEYLNPSLNSTTNQAKLNEFTKTLDSTSRQSLENNIINPLSQRNMIRSSQATDLYKNLSDQNTDELSSYINELLAEAQNNTAGVINNLLQAYMQGYDVVSDTQSQSLNASQGNATTTSNLSTGSNLDTVLNTSSQALDTLTKLAQLMATATL